MKLKLPIPKTINRPAARLFSFSLQAKPTPCTSEWASPSPSMATAHPDLLSPKPKLNALRICNPHAPSTHPDLPSAKRTLFISILCLFLLSFVISSKAQTLSTQPGLQIVPIPHLIEKTDKPGQNLRTQAVGDTISLPFWDDFSVVRKDENGRVIYQADTTKWMPSSKDVRINYTAGINLPSLGVATFDGVNAFGIPHHSSDPQATGLADSLISRPINMAAVPENERNTVFFSFFWQFKGLGEFPDAEDSLRLQFKNNAGEWITQWVQGGNLEITDEFEQEIFQVNDPTFFHAGFQFRFQSFGRLSADFDVWHVDYVFLNKNRTIGNTTYLDRALTTRPTSIFKDFTAIPMNQFRLNPAKYIDTSSVEFFNLDVLLQPIEYTALVRNKLTGELIDMMDDKAVVNPIPQGLERRTIKASPVDPATLNTEADSLYLETEIHIISGDTLLNEKGEIYQESVNYVVNDTARSTFVLHDYYAYDDGSAEVGVGVNQNQGKIAYQFILEEPDSLTHIDIYFPAIASQSSVPIILFVWSALDREGVEQVLRDENFTAQRPANIDEPTAYKLSKPVIVRDTFYIGFQQLTQDFLAVGLDKNTDSGDKIFFNVTGAWQQNTDIQGSLMMRPRFGESETVVGIDDEIQKEKTLNVYPNPSTGQFQVKGLFTDLVIRDILGKEIPFTISKVNTELHEVNLSFPQPGIYLISFTTKEGLESHRILVH